MLKYVNLSQVFLLLLFIIIITKKNWMRSANTCIPHGIYEV